MFSAFQVFSLAPFRHTDLAAPFSEILPNKVQDKCGTDAGQPPHDFCRQSHRYDGFVAGHTRQDYRGNFLV